MIALSYSRLSMYENCPRQFQLKHLKKSLPDDSDNPAFVKGRAIHEQLQQYMEWLQGQRDEPYVGDIAANGLPMLKRIFHNYPVIHVEQQYAINLQHKAVEWYSRQAYYRCVIDLIAMRENEALLCDHKSGRVYDLDEGDTNQLRLNAWMTFHLYPEIERITSSYLYIEHKHSQKQVHSRDELPEMDRAFREAFDEVNKEKEWPPRKNSKCRWCTATREQCPFGGN